jgi:hypothetical protein
MLASYLGYHSQVLESGASSKMNLSSSESHDQACFYYFTTRSNSNKDKLNGFEVPLVWVHEDKGDCRNQWQSWWHTWLQKITFGLEQCWWLSDHCFQQVVVDSSISSILKSQPMHPVLHTWAIIAKYWSQGQAGRWFYLVPNPMTKLASTTLLLEAIATRTTGMVLKYLHICDHAFINCPNLGNFEVTWIGDCNHH